MHEVAAHDEPGTRKALYDAFLESMLLVPVPRIPGELAPGLQTVSAPIELQLTTIVSRNHALATPAFTDLEALRNWNPNALYLGIKAQDLFRFVMSTEIQEVVMNPFGPAGKMIRPGGIVTRAEMGLLAQGVAPLKVGPANLQFQLKANERVMIGLPSQPPGPEVEQLLQACAAGLAEIAALYLFQMATQQGGSHTVIGIELKTVASQERQAEIAGRLGESIRPGLKSGQALDFMFVGPPLIDQMKRLSKEIFRKP